MRHPFEAYVRFWEVISGTEKQKCPPEIAVAKLERHFASHRRGNEVGRTSNAVVLLLDEIDYLVTKKQTVLYNFFDWPRRACENGTGPRLIVIGISNTLNLPSRLKPSVQSRLGSEMCGYKSYNVKDIVVILKTKVQSNKPVRHGYALMVSYEKMYPVALTCHFLCCRMPTRCLKTTRFSSQHERLLRYQVTFARHCTSAKLLQKLS